MFPRVQNETSGASIETHLVLSCAAKSSDLSNVVDRYGIFRPTKLLFTRLDETGTYGSILNEAARTRLPISFLASGQRIPDDLQPATRSHIADLVMGSREGRAAAA